MAVKRLKKNRSELRNLVLKQAAKAFFSQGIRTVHMDDIAASLSISKRTLYELFHDKQQLLLEVLCFQRNEMHAHMEKIASKAENALEVIFAFYEKKSSELCEMNPAFFRDLKRYPEVLEFLRQEQRSSDKAAVEHFRQGVEQGIFRKDINFDIITKAMSMQLDVLVYSDLTDSYPLTEIYSEITILHMRGITTEKGACIVDRFLQTVRGKNMN
ncbi:MAG: TetR/AcrR family transcriptional regulator [Bacteroides sp.]|nr:TetR/AcrR family transcriptional regulator [Bacteroides sp.]